MRLSSSRDVLVVVAASIMALTMPVFMRTLGVLYLILYFDFCLCLPLFSLLFAPRLSLWIHLVPLLICIGGTLLRWKIAYGEDSGPGNWPLLGLVTFIVFPIGMFLVSYAFFWVTLRTRKR
jgi:hypothetical protein